MVDQIRSVSFTTPAGTGNFDITHAEITETCKAAVVFYGNSQNDDTNEAPGRMGLALLALEDASHTGGTMSALLRNALAAPQCRNGHLDAAGIQLARNSAFLTQFDVIATTPSAVAGGLRLNFTDTTQRVNGHAVLFAGAAMRAWGGTLQASTSSAHETVGGGVTFQPDLVLVMGAKEGAINAGQSLDCVIGLGAVTPGGQKCVSTNIDNLTEPSDADGEFRSAHGIVGLSAARAAERITFTIDATGFNYIASAGTPNFYYLAIKFGSNVRLAVANMAVAASGGNQAFNAFGFNPDVVIGQASLLTTEDSLTDGAKASCAGLFSFMARGGHQRSYTVALLAGNSGTSAAGGQQSNSALLLVDDTGALVQKAAYNGSSGSGGFLLNFSTASTAGNITALGIQIVPNPTPSKRRRARALQRTQQRQPKRTVARGKAATSAKPKRRARSMRRAQHRKPARATTRGRGAARAIRGFWRTVIRQRWAMLRRRWLKIGTGAAPPAVPGVDVAPNLTAGDNAMAGSQQGANALAGSDEGDSA